MEQIWVRTAQPIIETYTFTAANGSTYSGKEGEGGADVSWTTDGLQIYIISLADVESWDVSSEVVEAIGKRCEIADEHKSRLGNASGTHEPRKTLPTFPKEGYPCGQS
jgi:hypothetical protein